jgi:hypothetical protein
MPQILKSVDVLSYEPTFRASPTRFPSIFLRASLRRRSRHRTLARDLSLSQTSESMTAVEKSNTAACSNFPHHPVRALYFEAAGSAFRRKQSA